MNQYMQTGCNQNGEQEGTSVLLINSHVYVIARGGVKFSQNFTPACAITN